MGDEESKFLPTASIAKLSYLVKFFTIYIYNFFSGTWGVKKISFLRIKRGFSVSMSVFLNKKDSFED